MDGSDPRLRRLVRTAAFVALVVSAMGFLARLELETLALERPRIGLTNAFEVLFYRSEPPFLLLLAAFSLVVLLLAGRAGRSRLDGASRSERKPASFRLRVGLVAAIVLLASAWGTRDVFHDYPLAMDEFAATFQAKIFSRGSLMASIPDIWQSYAYSMDPIFIAYKPLKEQWFQAYLPMYAAIRALFRLAGLESWTNAVLAAASIVLIGGVSRRMWPDRWDLALLATVFLASSSQFLLTSMSVAYSMPAHLCLNLLWLYCHLAPNGNRQALAVPWIGAIALGLHNPFPHALFAAPFFLRLLRSRQFRRLGYWLAVYIPASVVWYEWLHYSYLGATEAAGLQDLFGIPPHLGLLPRMGVVSILSWQSPLVAILFLLGLISWRALPAVGRDLAAGAGLTVLFYSLFVQGQGHGWGYRFFYGALGNLVLLALFAYQRLGSEGSASRLVGASLLASLVVQIPLRTHQAAAFSRPFVRAAAFVKNCGAGAVVVDRGAGWYFQDFVRNDPFLENDPKVFFAERFPSLRRQSFHKSFPRVVIHDLRPEEVAPFGVPVIPGAPR